MERRQSTFDRLATPTRRGIVQAARVLAVAGAATTLVACGAAPAPKSAAEAAPASPSAGPAGYSGAAPSAPSAAPASAPGQPTGEPKAGFPPGANPQGAGLPTSIDAPAAAGTGGPTATLKAELRAAQAELERASSDCTRACRALGSMERATARLCTLEESSCEDVRQRLRRARERVRASCRSCADGTSVDPDGPILGK